MNYDKTTCEESKYLKNEYSQFMESNNDFLNKYNDLKKKIDSYEVVTVSEFIDFIGFSQ